MQLVNSEMQKYKADSKMIEKKCEVVKYRRKLISVAPSGQLVESKEWLRYKIRNLKANQIKE